MTRGVVRLLIALTTLVPLMATAQNDGGGGVDKMRAMSVDDYILKYAPIAKAEMKRMGIPASITIAQGILESNFGNSELAKNANNHFGIKCHSDWKGKGYYMDDDKKNECFRVYKNAEESFTDHSNYLKTRTNYASLFKLDPKDYKSWAKGLKNAGYATNPQYANLLIHMIEEHKLTQLDDQEAKEEKVSPKDVLAQYDNKVMMFNNIKTVVVQPGETLDDVARKYNISKQRLMNYNDIAEGDSLPMASKIYLQPKRFRGFNKLHEVKKGENMKVISQKEGIKLWSLYRKNRMEWGQEAAVGESLCLQSRCANPPKLKPEELIRQEIRDAIDARSAEQRKKFVQERADSVAKAAANPSATTTVVTPEVAVKETPTEEKVVMPKTVKDTAKVASAEPTTVHTIPIENPGDTMPLIIHDDGVSANVIVHHDADTIFHEVKAKETLYSISQKYYTTVDNLKKWNNLILPISIGQKLIVAFGKIPDAPKPIEMINKTTPEEPKPVAEKPKPANEKPVLNTTTTTTEYHTVKAGEGLFGIAKLYKITTGQIKEWNHMTSDDIKPGQKLRVSDPSKTTTEAKPAVKTEPAPKVEKATAPTTTTPADEAGDEHHTVAAGETLYSIARSFGVTVAQLKAWNSLTDLNLQIGQKLVVRKK